MFKKQMTSLKINVRYWKCYFKALMHPSANIEFEPEKKYAFVMLSANYNNLGDIAITKAQIDFLKTKLPKEYQVIEIPHNEIYSCYKSIKKHIDKTSIITLIGGGNSGTLYEFIEGPRRFILKKFKNNHIVSFPQSVFYTQDERGRAYEKAFERAAKGCTDLTLIAREQRSYEWYKSLMQGSDVKVLLTPDIVFSMKVESHNDRDNKITVIMREDKEKTEYANLQTDLNQALVDSGCDIAYCDTCDVNVSNERFGVLQEYLLKIGKSKLVITDRLHGMIFSYITNTPCIVYDNNNHKIESTVKTWLSDQKGVVLCGEKTNLSNEIRKILSIESTERQVQDGFEEKYLPLVHVLKNCVSRQD